MLPEITNTDVTEEEAVETVSKVKSSLSQSLTNQVEAHTPSTACIGPQHAITTTNGRCQTHFTQWGAWWSSLKIKGDGNCMFSAFAEAHGGITHKRARAKAVAWLAEWDELDDWVAADPEEAPYASGEEYLAAMCKDREWGDQIALKGLVEAYKVRVMVLKLEYNRYTWSQQGDTGKVIRLFCQGRHYELLYSNVVQV